MKTSCSHKALWLDALARPCLARLCVFAVLWASLFSPVATRAQTPVIATHPTERTIAPGASVAFSVAANGAQPLRYQWRRNGQNLRGETNSTLVFPNAQPTNGGSYSVTVFNAAGAAQSRAAVLLVTSPALGLADDLANRPVFSAASGLGSGSNVGTFHEPGEPEHAGRDGGNSVWLGWVAPGNGVVTFRTFGSSFDTLLAAYHGSAIANLTNIIGNDDRGVGFNSEISFNVSQGVQYLIAVDGRGGAQGNIVLSWNFRAGPQDFPRISYQPESVATTLSNFVTFYVTVDGTVQYQWLSNGVPIPGETALGTSPTAVTSKLGVYTVLVTNGTSATESDPAVLEIASHGATPTADKFEDALEAAEYSFAPSAPKKNPPRLVSLAAGAIGSQIFNNHGSSGEDGEPLHCGVSGGASRWQVVEAQSDGTMVLDTAGSTPDTVLAVYVGSSLASLQRVAEDDNSGPDGRSAQVSFPVTAGTRYYVAIDTVGGATGLIQFNWRLGRFPALFQPAIRVFDSGEFFSLQVSVTGGLGPFTYQWFKDGQPLAGQVSPSLPILGTQSAEGLYTLAVSNLVGIISSTIRLVQKSTVPVFVGAPQDAVVAQGTSLTLGATAVSTLPVRYQWQFRNKPIQGATNASYVLNPTSARNSGRYRVLAITSGGSATSTVANVSVLLPPRVIRGPKPVVVGNSGKVTLSVRAAGSGPLHYQWQNNGGNLPGATNATLRLQVFQPGQLGAYRCVVTNPVGDYNTDYYELLGIKLLQQPRDLTVRAGRRVVFSSKATGPSPLHYQWWKDGIPLSGATNRTYVLPSAAPADQGDYYVRVSSLLALASSTNARLSVVGAAAALAASRSEASPPWIPRLSVQAMPDGTLRIVATGVAGETCHLEATEDLRTWYPIAEGKADAGGWAVFQDRPTVPRRFYRVVVK